MFGLFHCFQKCPSGTSPAVQRLRLCLPMQGVWVQSLVGELRSHTWPKVKTKEKEPFTAPQCPREKAQSLGPRPRHTGGGGKSGLTVKFYIPKPNGGRVSLSLRHLFKFPLVCNPSSRCSTLASWEWEVRGPCPFMGLPRKCWVCLGGGCPCSLGCTFVI